MSVRGSMSNFKEIMKLPQIHQQRKNFEKLIEVTDTDDDMKKTDCLSSNQNSKMPEVMISVTRENSPQNSNLVFERDVSFKNHQNRHYLSYCDPICENKTALDC